MYYFELNESSYRILNEGGNVPLDEIPPDEQNIPEDVEVDNFKPLKKYFLIQKIYDLANKLNQLNIQNNSLNLIITFIDSFSYETLLSILKQVFIDLESQMKELKINLKDQNSQKILKEIEDLNVDQMEGFSV